MVGCSLFFGCGPMPPVQPGPSPVSMDSQVRELIKLGEERLAHKNYLTAGDAFRAGLKLEPYGEQDARLLLGLARAQIGSGDPDAALGSLGAMLAKHPDSPLWAEGQLLAAKLERDLGKCPYAITRLRSLLSSPPHPLSDDERVRATGILASCLSTTGHSGMALDVLKDMINVSGGSMGPETLAKLADLAGQVTPTEVETLLALAEIPTVRAALRLGLARALFRAGRLDEAESALTLLKGSPEAAPLAGSALGLEQEIAQARLVSPRAVGLILPLSGSYAAYGRQVLAAIELGLGLFGQTAAHPPTLYIEDSKGDPVKAAEAVSRLVSQRKVIAIIGPMGAASSLAAARVAQQEQVPLITLSQVEGVTQAGEYVFQNFFTPGEQVTALLSEFMDKRGLTKFAMLAPRNEYGSGFVKLFAEGVAARGGQIVRTVYYDTKQTDFSAQVKELVKLPAGNYRPGMPDSPQPVIDFEALFIPDGAGRAGMVIPNLAYFDVNYVWLLGTNLWHNQQLWDMAERYMRWAVFPDAFDMESARPVSSGFVRDFREAMETDPNVLAAHGFDTALILRHLVDRPEPPRTREGMRRALSELRGLGAACGTISMGPDRRVRKDLTLLIRRNNRFQPLAETQMVVPPPEDAAAAEGQGGAGQDRRPPVGGPPIKAPASTIAR